MIWDEVAAAGGISVATLRRVRKGATLTTDNKVAIERGLRWAANSVDRILVGGDPELLGGSRPTDPSGRTARVDIVNATPEQLVEMRQVVEDVMGAEAADEFLRRALKLRAAGDDRAKRQGGTATG
jgi:hypothetical protein